MTRAKTSSRPIELFGLASAEVRLRNATYSQQRHDVDAVLFEHGALRQVDPVHREQVELVAHARPGARQKARPHPVGDLAEPQIDARRLDLVVADRLRRQDLAPQRHRLAQHLRRQETGRQIPLALGLSGVRGRKQVAACGLGHSRKLRSIRGETCSKPMAASAGIAAVFRCRHTRHPLVMAGLDPAIHEPRHRYCQLPWIPGERGQASSECI